MKEQCNEVKNSIYAGMSIYDTIKNYIVKVSDEKVLIEDKKYLSLYLGILATDNKISRLLKEIDYNIEVRYENLTLEEYLSIYNNCFVEIFDEVNFGSMDEYSEYLLSKGIIKNFNYENNIPINKINKEKNKTLVKQIR